MKALAFALSLFVSLAAYSFTPATTATLPLGIAFQVQAGPLTSPVSQDLLDQFPVSSTASTEAGEFVFFGPFLDYREVSATRKALNDRALPSVDVQAYFNRKPISLEDAFILMDNQNKYEAPAAPEEEAVSVDDLLHLLKAGDAGRSMYFTVHWSAVENAPSPRDFHHHGPVAHEVTETGLNRYAIGRFPAFEEAAELARELSENGREGAFVGAFINGERADLALARKVEEHLNRDVALTNP